MSSFTEKAREYFAVTSPEEKQYAMQLLNMMKYTRNKVILYHKLFIGNFHTDKGRLYLGICDMYTDQFTSYCNEFHSIIGFA
jgi:hypothetical protein